MPVQAQATARTDLEIDRGAHILRLIRVFDAPRTDIFEAWTRPEHVRCWWDAAGEPLTVCEIDLRPGGAFKFVSKGHPDMAFTGTYHEIAPPERLVFEAIAGARAASGYRRADAYDRRDRMRIRRAARAISEDGGRYRHGADARQSRCLCARPSGWAFLSEANYAKALRATPRRASRGSWWPVPRPRKALPGTTRRNRRCRCGRLRCACSRSCTAP